MPVAAAFRPTHVFGEAGEKSCQCATKEHKGASPYPLSPLVGKRPSFVYLRAEPGRAHSQTGKAEAIGKVWRKLDGLSRMRTAGWPLKRAVGAHAAPESARMRS
eukprot:5470971-Pleurochrysis_carterae.AAC.3